MKHRFLMAFIVCIAGLSLSVFASGSSCSQTALGSSWIETLSTRTTDLSYAPPAFVSRGKKFVPIDILKSQVVWKVSSDLKKITAVAEITFQVGDEGFPFLLLNPNSQASLNGESVDIQKMDSEEFEGMEFHAIMANLKPNESSKVQLSYTFEHDPQKNKHILPLQYYFSHFVEKGLPANGPYDHFSTALLIEVEGNKKFELLSNGSVEKKGRNIFQVNFPDHFTSLSYYIDLVPKRDLVQNKKILTSLNGRKIHSLVYATRDDRGENVDPVDYVDAFGSIIEFVFQDMERQFGDYPYDSIIMKVSEKEVGGGAYAGALVLSVDYLEHMSHELGHSWYLQSVSPATGADSWIFEGLGDWAPLYRSGLELYENLEDSIFMTKNPYQLWATDEMFPTPGLRVPHKTGSLILSSIDQSIRSRGGSRLSSGLIPILKKIAARKKHQTMSTLEFKELLEEFTGLSFDNLFEFYVGDWDKYISNQ